MAKNHKTKSKAKAQDSLKTIVLKNYNRRVKVKDQILAKNETLIKTVSHLLIKRVKEELCIVQKKCIHLEENAFAIGNMFKKVNLRKVKRRASVEQIKIQQSMLIMF